MYTLNMTLTPKDRSQWPIHVGPLHDIHAGKRDMAYWMSPALLGKATEAVSIFSIYHWTTMRHA